MPKFLIEREIPNAGELSEQELRALSQRSCAVLRQMGPLIQWMHSYVTDNKIYCVYFAPDAETIREHARRGGFPADRIEQIREILDPASAESPECESPVASEPRTAQTEPHP